MSEIIGLAPCPECGEVQSVYFDTRKYYIKCSSCHTFTNYQSKAAKTRLEDKLQETEPELPEDLPEAVPVIDDPPLPEPETIPLPENQPSNEGYADWY